MSVFKYGDVWMKDKDESVSRAIAGLVMLALKMDIQDWRTRDNIIHAIDGLVTRTLDDVAENNIYFRAIESMSRQFICPRMTPQELAEAQLGGDTREVSTSTSPESSHESCPDHQP